MADVKEGDVVPENAIGSGAELRSTRSHAYEQLQIVMKYVCMVRETLSQKPPEPVN